MSYSNCQLLCYKVNQHLTLRSWRVASRLNILKLSMTDISPYHNATTHAIRLPSRQNISCFSAKGRKSLNVDTANKVENEWRKFWLTIWNKDNRKPTQIHMFDIFWSCECQSFFIKSYCYHILMKNRTFKVWILFMIFRYWKRGTSLGDKLRGTFIFNLLWFFD